MLAKLHEGGEYWCGVYCMRTFLQLPGHWTGSSFQELPSFFSFGAQGSQEKSYRKSKRSPYALVNMKLSFNLAS